MGDCPNVEVRDLLPELASGALAPEERAAVESHLASCEECRAELALLHAVRSAFARPPAIDAAIVAAALPRPDVRSRPARVRQPRRLMTWQLAAAVSLFAVGASSIWITRSASLSGSSPDSAARVAVVPEERMVTLGHRLGELSEQDLETLLGALDDLETLPAIDPVPMIAPLGGGEGS